MPVTLKVLIIFGTFARVFGSLPPSTTPKEECVSGTKIINMCEFTDWQNWPCYACCNTNGMAIRRRSICCGKSLGANPSLCYSTCGKTYGVDNVEKKPCSTVCTCTTPSSSTASSTLTSTTASSTVPTTSLSSSVSTITSLTTALAKDTLCYNTEKDKYHCDSKCHGTNDWNGCIRGCIKETYQGVCKAVCTLISVSLFILGVIVGMLSTCIVNCLCKKRQRIMQKSVSPESIGSLERDNSFNENEAYEGDGNFVTTKDDFCRTPTNARVFITEKK